MVLYAADILDLAQPVSAKKPRKQANPKRIAKAAQEIEPVSDHEADQEPEVEPTPAPAPTPVVKEKKPRTEKQIAALAKAQETRRLKKEAIDKEIADKQAELAAKEQEIADQEEKIRLKKEAAAEKRRLKRVAAAAEAAGEPIPQTPTVAPSTDDTGSGGDLNERPVKKRKVTRKEKSEDEEPPAWFKKIIKSTEHERAQQIHPEERKPKKQITQEAGALATSHWNNKLTRDRIQEELSGHRGRLMQATQPAYSRRMR